MRFGKRGKNPLSWGWRAAGAQEEQPQEPDASTPSELPEQPLPPELTVAPSTPPEAPRTAKEGRVVTSDPTQRLLTSLGRFQRQFMKARDGAPQAQWSDECMNHLIQGVEIALEQEWGDLVEALTETGRILQTYEDAGRANQCVPFLADSYEILCLMVGDLIVDKVRTGVMRKWRDRYQSALEELAADGLTLLEDDEDRGGYGLSRSSADALPDSDMPPVEREAEATPVSESSAESEAGLLGELPPLRMLEPQAPSAPEQDPYFDQYETPSSQNDTWQTPASESGTSPWDADLAGVHEEPGSTGATAEKPFESESPFDDIENHFDNSSPAAAPALSRDLAEILDAFCDGLAQLENDPEGSLGTVFLSMDDTLSTLRDRARLLGWNGSASACDAMARLCSKASERQGLYSDRFFEIAYAFSGVYGEIQDRQDDPQLNSWVAELNQLLDQWSASEAAPAISAATPEPDTSPFELPDNLGSSLESAIADVPSFDDVALGPVSGDVPQDLSAEISTGPGEDAVAAVPSEPVSPEVTETSAEQSDTAPDSSWSGNNEASESGEAMSSSGTVPEREATPPQPPVEFVEISSAEPQRVVPAPLDDPASQLLDTARQAVASGSSSDAKMLAMQAAASIARAQAKEAEARVRQAEVRLQETAKSIELARKQVQEAEVQVTDAEIRVDEGKEALAERGRHTHGVMGSLDGIRSRISDLDRRIQELQAQREEAVRQQGAAETALDEARQQESEVRAHLDSLKNAEQMARVRLEDSRGQVKLLQRKQAEIEAIMERARESLTRHRESMADIEKTIEVIRSAETGDGLNGNDLLF
ncbi:MAG: hypothetical protein IT364_24240 [Candidatus Hydrogenedentes bacterium]|nr:hypothetical protein [Candidatus Hydrogenedentota bacterium]